MTGGLRISMGLGLAALAVLVARDFNLITLDLTEIPVMACRAAEVVSGFWK